MDEKLQSLRSLIDGMLKEAQAAQLRKEYRKAERILKNAERYEKRYIEEQGKVINEKDSAH